jgi:hypothetical protein
MKRLFVLAATFVGALVFTSCTLMEEPSGPPPLAAPSVTPLPAAEVTLWAVAPPSTSNDATVQVEFFDELAGFATPVSVVRMEGDGAGTWSVGLTPPSGSVLYYRYARNAPGQAVEADARGNAIVSRLALVDGATQIYDVIAAWVDAPEVQPIGRIVGLSPTLPAAPRCRISWSTSAADRPSPMDRAPSASTTCRPGCTRWRRSARAERISRFSRAPSSPPTAKPRPPWG